MALKQITPQELAGKGVRPLADVPGLPGDAMKAKFEEIVREVVIPAFNENAGNTYDIASQEARYAAVIAEAKNAAAVEATQAAKTVMAETLTQVNQALATALAKVQVVLDEGMLISDPTTGLVSPVQTVVNNLFALHAAGAIHPEEFDALGLLPEVFDTKAVDPYYFDLDGKNILN